MGSVTTMTKFKCSFVIPKIGSDVTVHSMTSAPKGPLSPENTIDDISTFPNLPGDHEPT
jgi:hypothetical protein